MFGMTIAFVAKIWKDLLESLLKFRRWYVYRKSPSHFLSPDRYYAEFLDEKSSIHHLCDCVGREDELAIVLDAVDSGKYRAINISGSPGSGLSRFLLEFSKLLEGRGRGLLWYFRRNNAGNIWTVYFARKGSSGLIDHLSKLRKGNIVIMFDCPQDEIKDVAQLIEHAPQARSEGKVIIVSCVRKAMSNDVQQAYLGASPGSAFNHELVKLSRQDIAEVIRKNLPKAHPQEVTRIQNLTEDSVFLTVFVCIAIERNNELYKNITDQNFIFRVCIQPMRESIASIGIPEWQCSQILATVAVLCPFDISANETIETVAELTSADPSAVKRLMNSAVQAGLFEKYASKLLRPTPKLFGTLLIEQACIEEDGSTNEFGQGLISSLLQSHPDAVIRNAADVGWSRGNPLKLVKEYIRQLRNGINTRKASEQVECLELVQKFAPVDPIEVMDYVELLVSHYQQNIVPDTKLVEEWRGVFSDISPLLVFCSENYQSQPKTIEIARILFVEGAIDTSYGNRTAEDCLEKIVGFTPLKSVKLNRRALEQVQIWFRKDLNSTKAALCAIRGLLKPTLEWEESDEFTFTWSKQLIGVTEEIVAIRNEALSLVCDPELLTSMHTTSLAFDVLESVGQTRGGPALSPDSELYTMLQSEERFVLGKLIDAYDEGMPVVSRVLLEKHLWSRWAWGSDNIAVVAEEALARCADSPACRLQRFLLNGEVPVSIEEMLTEYQEREQKRRDIYISERRDNRENSEKVMNELIGQLGYGDIAQSWFSFLRSTSKGVEELSWRSWQFFNCLAKLYPITAWEIYESEESEPWASYQVDLLTGLRKSDPDSWFKRLEALDTSSSDKSLVNWLYAVQQQNADAREIKFVSSVSGTKHVPVANAVVRYLAHANIGDWFFNGELLVSLIEKFPTEKNIDELFSFLSFKRPAALLTELCELDERCLTLLLREDLPDNVPWVDPHWIGPYLKNIASIDPARFLDFLNLSTNVLDESRKYAIEILGLRNSDEAIKVLMKSIGSASLIDHFVQLSVSPNTIPSAMGINLITRNFEIQNDDLQNAFAVLRTSGEYSNVARILGGFEVSEGWLVNLKALVISCIENGGNLDELKSLVSSAFYSGVTSRTPGNATPRDKLVAQKMTEFLSEGNLPALARSYFGDIKDNAESSIRNDLDGDERLVGRKLTKDEYIQQKD